MDVIKNIKEAVAKGIVKENPDDATDPWTLLDFLCKVMIRGKVQIPPLEFQDEELELINIRKG